MDAKCILFDCDGTLVDSENITNRVVARMAAELGVRMTLREAQNKFGGKTLDAVIYGMKELSGKEIPNDWLPRLVKEVSKAYETDLIPMDGVKELLDNIKIPICVASNGDPRHVKSSLVLTGLLEYFEGNIFTASEVKSPKPAPDLFLYAAKRMGFKPNDCIVIEDSIPGVTAAVNANIKVYGLIQLCSAEQLKNAGAIPFKTMHELSKLLGI
jgi:HAD superfamily hydrolase (TIGR01509 family)|tara:strand:- start:6014 stop:6652 length:639 start_codon:yes stop_codon:yes gene_type:complete